MRLGRLPRVCFGTPAREGSSTTIAAAAITTTAATHRTSWLVGRPTATTSSPSQRVW